MERKVRMGAQKVRGRCAKGVQRCANVHGKVHKGVQRCARVCKGAQWCAKGAQGARRCAKGSAEVRGRVRRWGQSPGRLGGWCGCGGCRPSAEKLKKNIQIFRKQACLIGLTAK